MNNQFTEGFSKYQDISHLTRHFDRLFRFGILREGSSFMDWGAGDARCIIAAANSGFRAYGIEINREVFGRGIENIRISKSDEDSDDRHLRGMNLGGDSVCELVEGSFYPRDYVEGRGNGGIAARYESGRFLKHHPSGRESRYSAWDESRGDENLSDRFLLDFSERDPYDALGLDIGAVEVFFSYSWGPEIPSQLELFRNYAHEDSKLLIDCAGIPEDLEGLAGELGLHITNVDLRYEENWGFYKQSLKLFTRNPVGLDMAEYWGNDPIFYHGG